MISSDFQTSLAGSRLCVLGDSHSCYLQFRRCNFHAVLRTVVRRPRFHGQNYFSCSKIQDHSVVGRWIRLDVSLSFRENKTFLEILCFDTCRRPSDDEFSSWTFLLSDRRKLENCDNSDSSKFKLNYIYIYSGVQILLLFKIRVYL